ncbi:ImmA/IrrE family metallo-endopeptidase [Paenibacillus apiarius]|uniref:ImmA/IrrE family metallo-endopeptidase n=1 Tax=Paenibacillus apiarius TaxID=46240 RepID=UPI003B3A868B
MLKHYQMTRIEEFQEELYHKIGITEPSQLTLEDISVRLNVWIYYGSFGSEALEVRPGMYSMNIDSRLEPTQQWLEFLHELCHLLRHAGDQSNMPEQFTQAQEDEADAFAMYASMPFGMIRRLPLPERRCEAAAYLAQEFRVSLEMAERRLDQIRRRVFAGCFFAAIAEQDKTQRMVPQLSQTGGSYYAY